MRVFLDKPINPSSQPWLVIEGSAVLLPTSYLVEEARVAEVAAPFKSWTKPAARP
jgi:hypothetical protein